MPNRIHRCRGLWAIGALLVPLLVSPAEASHPVNGQAFTVTPPVARVGTAVSVHGACYGSKGANGGQDLKAAGTPIVDTCENDVSTYSTFSTGLKLRFQGLFGQVPLPDPNGKQSACNSSSPAIGSVTVVANNADTGLVVKGEGRIPPNAFGNGSYMVCADPDPATLWGFITVNNLLQPAPENLQTFFPNPALYKDYYLSAPAQNAVLWFEELAPDVFKMYNSGPYDRCHWDLFNWASGTLGYSQTHHECGGVSSDIIYNPPVTFMPKIWDGNYWSMEGKSTAVYYENGSVACTGINNWKTEILGWVELGPGVWAIEAKDTEVTDWKTGSSPSGCAAGYTSEYESHMYLIDDLPVFGSPGVNAKALKRTLGGNLANPTWDWDIWFAGWQALP